MNADTRERILVTGATGTMGSLLLENLHRRGASVVAAVRPGKTAGGLPEGVERCEFDFLTPSTWAPSLDGIDRLFLLRPPQISNIRRDLEPFLRFLAGTTVKQVLFLSVQGADRNSFVPHAKIEKLLIRLGIPSTFFRPSFFMQNLSGVHRQELIEENRLYLPAGKGRTNFVDVADLAEAGGRVLTEAGHDGRAYTLTGPESLTYYEIAARMSALLGRSIEYRPASIPGFVFSQLKRGRGLAFTLVMTALYSAARFGAAGGETPELESLLGRKPGTIEEFIQRNRSSFNGES